MESWRKVFRDGVAPSLSMECLMALATGLEKNDPAIIQGCTVVSVENDRPADGACALGYAGWVGEGLKTAGDVEAFFVKMCLVIDQRLGEPAASRWFLNWFDETPRDSVFAELLAEVKVALASRTAQEAA